MKAFNLHTIMGKIMCENYLHRVLQDFKQLKLNNTHTTSLAVSLSRIESSRRTKFFGFLQSFLNQRIFPS